MFRIASQRSLNSAASRFATTTNVAVRRYAASTPSSKNNNNNPISKWVSNVTPEKVEADQELKAFMQANFPQALDPDYEPPRPPHVSRQVTPGLEPVRATREGDGALHISDYYARNIRPMKAYLRDSQQETNSRRSRFLRYNRWIPGLLYGGDPTRNIYSHQGEATKVFLKTQWRLLERELDRYHRNFESRVYELTVLDDDDAVVVEPELVVPANVQRHPLHSTVYCVNYVRYHPGRPLQLPLRHINTEESPALKRDCFIIPIQRKVEVFVEDGADIPEALELECSGLQFKDVIRTDRLIVPSGVRFSDRVLKRGGDYILGVVDGRGRGLEDLDDTSDATATATAAE